MAEESKGDAEATLDKNSAATEDASEQFKNIKMATILSGEKNARGIPYVAFIDSVEGTLATTTDGTVEKLIGAMNELHQKFKILEGHKARTKASMKLKIPEIKRTLQLVRHIKEKHEAVKTSAPTTLSVKCSTAERRSRPTARSASGSARTSW